MPFAVFLFCHVPPAVPPRLGAAVVHSPCLGQSGPGCPLAACGPEVPLAGSQGAWVVSTPALPPPPHPLSQLQEEVGRRAPIPGQGQAAQDRRS